MSFSFVYVWIENFLVGPHQRTLFWKMLLEYEYKYLKLDTCFNQNRVNMWAQRVMLAFAIT